MERIEPVGDKVLVRDLDKDEMTAGGIALPQDADGTSRRSTVLAVGPLVERTAVGDTVVRTKFSGVAVQDGIIIEESDILADDTPAGLTIDGTKVAVAVALMEGATPRGLLYSLRPGKDLGHPAVCGTVCGVGPQVSDVKVGDAVTFKRYAGTRVTKFGEPNVVVMEEEDLECLLG